MTEQNFREVLVSTDFKMHLLRLYNMNIAARREPAQFLHIRGTDFEKILAGERITAGEVSRLIGRGKTGLHTMMYRWRERVLSEGAADILLVGAEAFMVMMLYPHWFDSLGQFIDWTRIDHDKTPGALRYIRINYQSHLMAEAMLDVRRSTYKEETLAKRKKRQEWRKTAFEMDAQARLQPPPERRMVSTAAFDDPLVITPRKRGRPTKADKVKADALKTLWRDQGAQLLQQADSQEAERVETYTENYRATQQLRKEAMLDVPIQPRQPLPSPAPVDPDRDALLAEDQRKSEEWRLHKLRDTLRLRGYAANMDGTWTRTVKDNKGNIIESETVDERTYKP